MDKPFLTFEQQIEKLTKEYNLSILDYNFALENLASISYYDLINGYKDIYQKDGKYLQGTTLEQLYITHILNKDIQGIIIKYATYVENSFKTILAYVIAQNISQFQLEYLNPSNYRRPKSKEEREHVKKLFTDIKNVCSSTQDTPTYHYRMTKDNIPPWILFKNISFSSITDIFKYLSRKDKECLFTYNRLLSSFEIEYSNICAIILTSLRIVRKFRNKAAHNLNFLTYRLPLNASANIIFNNTLLDECEINKIFDNIWGLIMSIILLLNNRALENNFLMELSIALKRYGEEMEHLYCNITGIPIDYDIRIKRYLNTIPKDNDDSNNISYYEETSNDVTNEAAATKE